MVSAILDSKDDIVRKIVEATGMPAADVDIKIKAKIAEYGGLLTDAGAAYSLARELDVELGMGEVKAERLTIGKLSDGLENVNVVGVVKRVFPVKTWEKDGKTGKVGNISIADNTGEVRVVLWQNDADMIESGQISEGTILEVKNGFVKSRKVNLNGVERTFTDLSIGMRGKLVINPKDAPELPKQTVESVKLIDLKEDMRSVTAYGRVLKVFPTNTFQKQAGEGKVCSVQVFDGSERRVVFWDETTALAEKLKQDDILRVDNCYVRKGRTGDLELHFGRSSRLLINPADAPAINAPQTPVFVPKGVERLDISELADGINAEIRATVVRVYPFNLLQVCAKCGKKSDAGCTCGADKAWTPIVNAELDDGTGVIRGVFFRDTAESFLGVKGQALKDTPALFDEKTNAMLGDEIVFEGQVKTNPMFDRREFVVRNIKPVDTQAEIAKMAK